MAEDKGSGKAKVKDAVDKVYNKSSDVQRRLDERFKRLGKGRYGRVLRMARRPTSEEYSKTVMITGLGILLIGLLGFVIYIIMDKGLPALREFLGI